MIDRLLQCIATEPHRLEVFGVLFRGHDDGKSEKVGFAWSIPGDG